MQRPCPAIVLWGRTRHHAARDQRRRLGAALTAALALLIADPLVAHAEERARPDPSREAEAQRPMPRYDGREPAEDTAYQALLWAVRVLVAPLYIVTEVLIRKPLGALFYVAEQHHIPERLIELFTFGPDRRSGIIPTLLIDFGLRTSGGLYFFWNAPDGSNGFRARAATGGPDWWKLALAHRVYFSGGQRLQAKVSYLDRPDYLFHGIGPLSGDQETRFGAEQVNVGFSYRYRPWRSSEIEVRSQLSHVDVDPGVEHSRDPSIDEAVAAGLIARPPGSETPYSIVRHHFRATLDTRIPRLLVPPRSVAETIVHDGSGVQLSGYASYAVSVRDGSSADEPRLQWIGYGGTLGGYLDITGTHRVLGLSVTADRVEPLPDSGAIPFFELPFLGGDRVLRGFRSRRLMDLGAAAAMLEYRWPVWHALDGHLHYAVGGVFGDDFDDLDPALWHSSFGIGVSSVAAMDTPFDILFAFGTERFEQGGGVESFRFVFGSREGL